MAAAQTSIAHLAPADCMVISASIRFFPFLFNSFFIFVFLHYPDKRGMHTFIIDPVNKNSELASLSSFSENQKWGLKGFNFVDREREKAIILNNII